MSRWIILFLFLTLAMATVGVNAFQDDFSEKILELKGKYKVPGVAVALIEEGEIVFLEGFGYRDRDRKKPVTPDTVFQVASISKPVAAIGALKLVEDGKWGLEDPIEKYLDRWNLPQSDYGHEGITLERLLSHTAGLGPSGYIGYCPDEEQPDLIAALEGTGRGSRGVTIRGEPGDGFQYSGGGYTVMEMALEDLTGQDFGLFIQENVLSPLGMENSTFNWEEAQSRELALPYSVYQGELPNYLFTERAAASLYSTARDLAVFLQYGLEIFQGKASPGLGEMFKPVDEGYGLGWQIISLPEGKTLAGHGGSNRGWKANMSLILEDGAGIVILTNSDRGMPFYRDLTNYWLSQQGSEYEISTPGRIMMYFIDLYQRIGLWYLRL